MMEKLITSWGVGLLALGLVAGGCGGDDEPTMQGRDLPFVIELDPARSWYRPEQSLTARVVPTMDEPADASASLQVYWFLDTPEALSTPLPVDAASEVQFALQREGGFVLKACETPDVTQACAERALVVDAGSPALRLDAPLPGQALSDEAGILVSGSVMDARMESVYINGRRVTVDEAGAFATRLAPSFGVHHIEVVASDGLTAPEIVELDVLWAPRFEPGLGASGRPAHRIEDAIGMSLDRRFFDDGSALERGAVPVVTRDVADILELVLYNADLDGYIPTPLIDEGMGLRASLSEVRVASADADVSLADGEIQFVVSIHSLTARTAGTLGLPGETVDLGGTLDIRANASAAVMVRKETRDAPLEVQVPRVSVQIEDVDGRFGSPEAGALFRLADGALRSLVEEEIRDAVSDELRAELAAIIRSTVRSLDSALSGGRFEINAPPLPPVELEYDARLRSVNIAHRDRLLAEMVSTTGVDTPAIFGSTPGVPRVSNVSLDSVFVPDAGVQVGVRVGLFNGLLHGLWAVGGMRFDATGLVPEALRGLVESVSVDGRLPPVLGPDVEGSSSGLRMYIGQLEIQFSGSEGVARYAANLSAGVRLRVDGNRVSTDVDELPELQVWTIEEPGGTALITDEVLESLLREEMWPELRRAVAQSLDQRIPMPNLRGLESIAPGIADTRFTFGAGERVFLREGVIVVEGLLLGEVPSGG